MIKLESYIALDIETSGLDLNQSRVLELAAIYDDGVSPIDKLSTFRMIVADGPLTYAEPMAMSMNADLLKEIHIARESGTYTNTETVAIAFNNWCIDLPNKDKKKLTLGGKNISGFDLPILANHNFNVELFKNRVIDVGSLYLLEFGRVPSLDEINALLGRSSVTHRALDDCFDVVHAIRAKFNKKD
jgi:oligoribonuclease (3'-5' exoribonuclease)